MKVTSLLRYSRACPFLGHSTPSSLRTLASTGSSTGANALTAKAIECPMMGPRLASKNQARAYASVAGNREVEEIHKVGNAQAGSVAAETVFFVSGPANSPNPAATVLTIPAEGHQL